jgi:hypothetical protein
MKLLWIVPLMLLTACASKPKLVLHPKEPATVVRDASVRYPEATRRYYVGRYVDPHNSLTMHEQHVVYRMEQTSRWNLHSGPSSPSGVTLLPAVSDPAFVPFPVNDAILAEINAQKAATTAVMIQTRQLSGALEQFQAALRQRKSNLQETTTLRATIATLEKRVMQLESAQLNPVESTNNPIISFPRP